MDIRNLADTFGCSLLGETTVLVMAVGRVGDLLSCGLSDIHIQRWPLPTNIWRSTSFQVLGTNCKCFQVSHPASWKRIVLRFVGQIFWGWGFEVGLVIADAHNLLSMLSGFHIGANLEKHMKVWHVEEAILAETMELLALEPHLLPPSLGWGRCFRQAPTLCTIIISPTWNGLTIEENPKQMTNVCTYNLIHWVQYEVVEFA